VVRIHLVHVNLVLQADGSIVSYTKNITHRFQKIPVTDRFVKIIGGFILSSVEQGVKHYYKVSNIIIMCQTLL
jgi:hypothetical protein